VQTVNRHRLCLDEHEVRVQVVKPKIDAAMHAGFVLRRKKANNDIICAFVCYLNTRQAMASFAPLFVMPELQCAKHILNVFLNE